MDIKVFKTLKSHTQISIAAQRTEYTCPLAILLYREVQIVIMLTGLSEDD